MDEVTFLHGWSRPACCFIFDGTAAEWRIIRRATRGAKFWAPAAMAAGYRFSVWQFHLQSAMSERSAGCQRRLSYHGRESLKSIVP